MTWRSSIDSRRAGLRLGARAVDLVADDDVREHRPGLNSNSRSPWLKTETPGDIGGQQVRVNWMRRHRAVDGCGRAPGRASVLPTPGTSSMSRWPSASSTVRAQPTASRLAGDDGLDRLQDGLREHVELRGGQHHRVGPGPLPHVLHLAVSQGFRVCAGLGNLQGVRNRYARPRADRGTCGRSRRVEIPGRRTGCGARRGWPRHRDRQHGGRRLVAGAGRTDLDIDHVYARRPERHHARLGPGRRVRSGSAPSSRRTGSDGRGSPSATSTWVRTGPHQPPARRRLAAATTRQIAARWDSGSSRSR